LETDK
jgi:hypothetical protein